jgi:hypothetical protein
MAVRREIPADRFIDVQYRDLLADPVGQFRRTLGAIGLTVTPQDVLEASTWMASNGRDTHPRHEYTAEEFGVTGRQLEETFKFYHDAFGVK